MKTQYFRIAFGFIVATFVVAFFAPMAIGMKFLMVPLSIFVWTLVVVAILVPFTALPVYLITTGWLGLNYKSIVLAAVISTVLVSSLIVFPFSADRSVVNSIILAENGSVTLDGYIHGLVRLAAMSAVGFVAGNAFYFSASVRNES